MQIAKIMNLSENEIYTFRQKNNILPTFKSVDTCAAEFEAQTPYCYSTYEIENEIQPLKGKNIDLGSGPTRIGQGLSLIIVASRQLWV